MGENDEGDEVGEVWVWDWVWVWVVVLDVVVDVVVLGWLVLVEEAWQ